MKVVLIVLCIWLSSAAAASSASKVLPSNCVPFCSSSQSCINGNCVGPIRTANGCHPSNCYPPRFCNNDGECALWDTSKSRFENMNPA